MSQFLDGSDCHPLEARPRFQLVEVGAGDSGEPGKLCDCKVLFKPQTLEPLGETYSYVNVHMVEYAIKCVNYGKHLKKINIDQWINFWLKFINAIKEKPNTCQPTRGNVCTNPLSGPP